jgi:hypothetical protein
MLRYEKEPEIPRLLHFVHKDRAAISKASLGYMEHCQALNPEWKILFHSDADIQTLLETHYKAYVEFFYALDPPMKRVDLSRYFLMHHYGGVYADLDYECVQPLDSWVPKQKAAWLSSWPDPALLISAKGEPFWIDAIEQVFQQPAQQNVWETTGPSGLNRYTLNYIKRFGAGIVLPPLRENHFDWDTFLKDEKGTGEKVQSRIGFISLYLFDPCSCSGGCLRECEALDGGCNGKYPDRYMVHHCHSSWRGTALGDA